MSVPQQGDSPAVADAIMKAARMYPLREFPGERRHPNTGWMIIDLVAIPPSAPDRPVTRTFQARDLINDEVSVHLSALRTQSFFTEVHKLLVFCGRLDNLNMLDWDDKALNELVCGLAEQDAKIMALTDDDTLWNVQDTLEYVKVVELFEQATKKGLETLTIYITWYDSSLFRELSYLRQRFRHESRQETRQETRLEALLESREDSCHESQEDSQQASRQESNHESRGARAWKTLTGKKMVIY